jgi:hypothetical protein
MTEGNSNRIMLQFPSKEEESPTKRQLRFGFKRRLTTPSPSLSPTVNNDTTMAQETEAYPMFQLSGFHLPSVVNYSTLLTTTLTLWVLYLLLPRGLRRHLCSAHPKRYKRSNPDRIIPILGRISSSSDASISRTGMIKYSFSESSVYSNSSSINSALRRGNEKFIAVKRGSPIGNQHSTTMDRRVESGIASNRRNVSNFDSDLSDFSIAKVPQDSGIYSERRRLINANSSDLTSIGTNEHKNSETLSSTGHAIWGTPKKIEVGKRIAGDDAESMSQGALGIPTNNSQKFGEIGPSLSTNSNSSPNSDVGSFASTLFSNIQSSTSGAFGSEGGHNVEASPIHPDVNCGHSPPSHMVLSSTLLSFRDPGIRLYAHGTQCEARRIWIRLDVNNERLIWRTENTAESNNPDLVTLGQVHNIPLMQVLFIDVGKATAALQLSDTHDDYCFSMLTNGGSLDLTASNKLERDAIVSCMCMILDTVYNHLPPERSWRRVNDVSTSVSSASYSSGSYSNNSDIMSPQHEYDLVGKHSSDSNASSNGMEALYSSSSTGALDSVIGSATGSDIFHGVDLGSQISATFGEI